jgi:hypothetical protein
MLAKLKLDMDWYTSIYQTDKTHWNQPVLEVQIQVQKEKTTTRSLTDGEVSIQKHHFIIFLRFTNPALAFAPTRA